MAMALALNGAAEVVVQVKNSAGGPRIHVNGEPVPPRFFAGLISGSVRTGPEWRDVSFDFAPPSDETGAGDGSIRFRFNHLCDFHLSGIRVIDKQTGQDVLPRDSFDDEKTFAEVWATRQAKAPRKPEPKASAVWTDKGVVVSLSGQVSGWWPTFHLISHAPRMSLAAGRTYRCTFRVRSSARALVNVGILWHKDKRWLEIGEAQSDASASQLRMARQAGIRLCHVQMPTCLARPGRPQNWEPIDRLFRQILQVVPDALIVPRIPAYAPGWWKARHPETVMVFEDGQKGRMVTVSSREHRRHMAEHFEKICRHLCETFPENFAGILPLGQGTYEWYYYGCQGKTVSGYDPTTEQAWRNWRHQHGKQDADSATIPSPGLRHGAPHGALRDPATERSLIEFARFRQEEMADTILEIAAACKRGSGGKKLVLLFYGYLFELGATWNGAYDSGHFALSRVLASDNVDILCGPLSYYDRHWCGSSPAMTAVESVLGAGKLWLNEEDCRTHLAGTSYLAGVARPEQSIDILRRSRGHAILRGLASWWLDIRDMGWHDDPTFWQIQHQLNPVEAAKLARTERYAPQIATIVDEDSMLHLSGNSRGLARPLVYESRAAFGRCGAPYGQYILDDVAAGRVAAPLQVFLAAWALTDSQRQQLRANRRAGTTRVWCHAPGYVRPTGFDLKGIASLTGFEVKPIQLRSAEATPTADGKKLGITKPWGPKTPVHPLFAVVPSAGDRILATFGDRSPALVVRTSQTGTDVYLAVPALTTELVRTLARFAGVHLYTQVDAAVWADGSLTSIHVSNDGPIEVTMPHAGTVTDIYSGRTFGTGPTVTVPARKGETLMLECEDVK